MSELFKELDYQKTPLGYISLRRRKQLKLNKDILGELELELETVELPAGLYYRVQAGPLYSRSSANTLCDKLRIKNQDCLIVAPW